MAYTFRIDNLNNRRFFLGYTDNIRDCLRKHKNSTDTNYVNQQLHKDLTAGHTTVFILLDTYNTLEQAKDDYEQMLLEHGDDERCYNTNTFEDNGYDGLSRMSKLKENARKPVSINGEIYLSVKRAAKQLGLPNAVVRNRVEDESLEYEDWFYVENKED